MAELPRELIEAILADPESDAPRLVAADWLDDAGDGDRAEFIRVQCEIARLQTAAQPSRKLKALRLRESALLSDPENNWMINLGPPPEDCRWNASFRRGFITRFAIDGQTMFDEMVPALFAIPLVEIFAAQIRGPLPAGWTQPIARLRNLRELSLRVDLTELTWDMIEPLTKLTRLHELRISQLNRVANLLHTPLRERFAQAREQIPAESDNASTRLSALRSRLGSIVQSTTSGLDYLHLNSTVKQELTLARRLTTLRRVGLSQATNAAFEAIAAMPMIRSLTVDLYFQSNSQSPSDMGLREISLTSTGALPLAAIGDWLAAQTNLETLRILEPWCDTVAFITQINRLRSLRVLHLPNSLLKSVLLERIKLPLLVELVCQIKDIDPLDWLKAHPNLRTVQLTPTPSLSLAIAVREFGIDLAPWNLAWKLGKPVSLANGDDVELAHGIHLRIPAGLERIEPARSPHATVDIEPLGAWQEFGPGDEWPDLRILAPTRIWIERIAAPTSTQSARKWLTGPSTPFARVKWSKFLPIETDSPIPPSVLMWSHPMLCGIRAVWIGKHHLIRLVSEFSPHRICPWTEILQGMVRMIHCPATM